MSFLTVKQFAGKHTAFSEASIRWIIFNSKTNGATTFIRKIGRKVLIEESSFLEWVNQQREA